MKKQVLKSCIYKTKIKDHESVKKTILDFIDRDDFNTENSYNDSISKFDYGNAFDYERPWVKYFAPFFNGALNELLSEMGIQRMSQMHGMWYQQYEENSAHGWHIHGGHMTGVYYLEFPKGCPHTNFIHPLTGRVDNIKAEEGDIVFFPSYIVHQAPLNKGPRKTIISYNFELYDKIIDDSLVTVL